MKIHEYQAKELFAKYSVAVPQGQVAFSVQEAQAIAEYLPGYPVVVKAQIHAGGRGKGGGVKLAQNATELKQLATEILGMTLVTKQTGPAGKEVGKLYIEQGLAIDQELYLALLPDRDSATIMIMASKQGGMDIEEVAATSPEEIIKIPINPLMGIGPYHLRQVGFELGLSGVAHKSFCQLLKQLYQFFVEYDCSMVEINPLVVTTDQQVLALDAKVDIDSNALYRHPDIVAMRDESEEDPLELAASKFNLNYINLEGPGTVGNMVNGAGLAMATMDIIKLAGASPANFLDVGGGADAQMVENGFRLILSDSRIKGILINIFGGILRCDVLATGIVQAARNIELTVPVVIRMEGTNALQGREILAKSGLQLLTAVDLADAALKVAKFAINEVAS